jgi:hypothetical protein
MVLGKRVAAVAGALGALAVAAPVADASAATTPTFAGFHLPALTAAPALTGFHLPAFTPAPLSFIGPSVGFVGVAIGPTVIGSVFNGATVVQVVNGPAGSSVIGSP